MAKECAQTEHAGSSKSLVTVFAKLDINELRQILQMGGTQSFSKGDLAEIAGRNVNLEDLTQKWLRRLCEANGIKCSGNTNKEMIAYLKDAAMGRGTETEEVGLGTESMCIKAKDKIVDEVTKDSRIDEGTQIEAKLKEELKIKDYIILQGTEEVRKLNEELKIKDSIILHGREEVRKLEDEVRSLKQQLRDSEKLRKKALNNILELKGTVRVFVRVLPLKDTRDSSKITHISYPESLEFNGRGINVEEKGQTHTFSYDKVFGSIANQNDIYEEVSELVQSSLDGFKVCILAYGETGSGKTYTMIGNSEEKGLIPRSLDHIFEKIHRHEEWMYTVYVSVAEVYQDSLYDLSEGNSLKIQNSELNEMLISSKADAIAILEKALSRRSVRCTNMNEQSSRSHFMFRLRMSAINKETKQSLEGLLNVMDLAGSEKMTTSGCIAESLNEMKKINKSLSFLVGVICAIQHKDDYVPFRNSKLTLLLKPYLSGGSKVLVIVNISPEISSVNETIQSLRFGSRLKVCEMGQPRHGEACSSLLSPNGNFPSRVKAGRLQTISSPGVSSARSHLQTKNHTQKTGLLQLKR